MKKVKNIIFEIIISLSIFMLFFLSCNDLKPKVAPDVPKKDTSFCNVGDTLIVTVK
jgi:hypothetical protein